MRSDALTPAQLVLWTGQQLAPDSPQYNCVFTFELHGPLDRDRFRKSYAILMQECENMRTVFRVQGGEVSQLVLPAAPTDLRVDKWTDSRSELASWISERAARQFNLSETCVEAVLWQLADDHHLFYLNQHHLIVDAWGVSVQYKRLAELYRGGGSAGTTESGQLPSFREYRLGLPTEPTPLPEYWNRPAQTRPPRLLGRSNSTGASIRPASRSP